MQKKITLAGVLALSAAMLLACGGKSSSASGSSEPAGSSEASSAISSGDASSASQSDVTSSGEGSDSSASSSAAAEYPTRVKITQPGTVLVGSRLYAPDYITTTPTNADGYTLIVKEGGESVVEIDGKYINVIGSGNATIQVTVPNGDKVKILGNIRLSAMSEAALEIQELANSANNLFAACAVWKEVEGKKVEDVDEVNDEFDSSEFALVVTPEYVLDWTYGGYSAIKLSDDVTYGFKVVDELGAELPGEEDETIADAWERADHVVPTQRVNNAYLTQYFVLEEVVDMTSWTEDVDALGNPYFYQEDPAIAMSAFGNMYGMVVDSFKDGFATVRMNPDDENSILFDFSFNVSSKNDLGVLTDYACFVSVELIVGDAARIPLLDDAAANLNPPAPADTDPLVNAFALFTDNYYADWEIGLFDRTTMEPLVGDVLVNAGVSANVNTVGMTAVNTDSVVYGHVERNYLTGELEEEQAFGGFHVDTENGGIYSLEADEDGLLVQNDTMVSGSDEINTWVGACEGMAELCTHLFTKTALDNASLSLNEAGVYDYDASFDEASLSALMSTLCPFSYTDETTGHSIFMNPDNAQYIEGHIYLSPETNEIVLGLFERVRISDTDSCLQGIVVNLYGAGEVPEINVGDPAIDLFQPEEEVDPEEN